MGNSLDKVLSGLYVGGIRASAKESILNKHGITHILSIHDRAAPLFKDRQYLCICAKDVSSQDLSQYFSECNDFIHQARLNGGSVLVHCVAGMSRSVTVTAAYIMTVTSLSWRDSVNTIRGARRCANPNFGFQRQLIAFYHDNIETEKSRLFTKFPKKLDLNDIEECQHLIAIHREFVLYGEEGKPKNLSVEDDADLYPIAHDAYKVKGQEEGGSSVTKPLDGENDDDTDESYIDMSKTSFKRPQSVSSPIQGNVHRGLGHENGGKDDNIEPRNTETIVLQGHRGEAIGKVRSKSEGSQGMDGRTQIDVDTIDKTVGIGPQHGDTAKEGNVNVAAGEQTVAGGGSIERDMEGREDINVKKESESNISNEQSENDRRASKAETQNVLGGDENILDGKGGYDKKEVSSMSKENLCEEYRNKAATSAQVDGRRTKGDQVIEDAISAFFEGDFRKGKTVKEEEHCQTPPKGPSNSTYKYQENVDVVQISRPSVDNNTPANEEFSDDNLVDEIFRANSRSAPVEQSNVLIQGPISEQAFCSGQEITRVDSTKMVSQENVAGSL